MTRVTSLPGGAGHLQCPQVTRGAAGQDDLETLIDTSLVGEVVLDARTGALKSVNRETRRLFSGLHEPDRPVEFPLALTVYVCM